MTTEMGELRVMKGSKDYTQVSALVRQRKEGASH